MTGPSITELNFTDLYIRLDDLDQALYLPRQKGRLRHNLPVPPEYRHSTDTLANYINSHVQGVDAGIQFEGVRMRVARQTLADDQVWACLRKINTEVPDID
ncbi:MAG: hypothetical protein EB121_09510, partial [Alphaproteobacteria bacterium]|nr:hypothetical protein [Alphaproteobacteria bacterium]